MGSRTHWWGLVNCCISFASYEAETSLMETASIPEPDHSVKNTCTPSHTCWDVLKFIFCAKPTMFIQWALSASPDLTPSHNGNAAAEDGRSQPLRSISVQPAAGSAAGDEGRLVLIFYMKAQKQFVQQLVKVGEMAKLLLQTCEESTETWPLLFLPEKKTNMRVLRTGTSWGHISVFVHVALRIKALIVGPAMSERMPEPSSPEPPPPAPQGKRHGIPRQDEW